MRCRNAKAAVEEGIVAGGGVALLQAAKRVHLTLEGDEAIGANIVFVALEAPLKQIAINAGLEGGVVAEKVRNLPDGQGLNAATGSMWTWWPRAFDPAKVTRSALQNAASIAGAVPDHRGRHRRQAGEGSGRSGRWRRSRHGWNGLLSKSQHTQPGGGSNGAAPFVLGLRAPSGNHQPGSGVVFSM